MATLFDVERAASRGEVERLLRSLADGLAVGTVTLEDDETELAVSVPALVAYELELETDDEIDETDDGTTVELEVEVSWTAGDEGRVPVPDPSGDRAHPRGGEPVALDATEDATDTVDVDSTDHEDDTDEPSSDTRTAEAGVGIVEDALLAGEATATESTAENREPDADQGSMTEHRPGAPIPIGSRAAPGSAARFELFTDRAGEWRWRLVHRNGNVIADSGEGYSRKIDARNGLESVRTNVPRAEVVETEDGE